jgi:hypothetical protein
MFVTRIERAKNDEIGARAAIQKTLIAEPRMKRTSGQREMFDGTWDS